MTDKPFRPKPGKVTIYTDGASRGNPGPAAIGAVITRPNLRVELSEPIGRATNNQAEYRAVIAALEYAFRLGASQVLLKSDSELIVNQLTGRYRVREPSLKLLFQEVKQLISQFESFTIECIPRELNAEADRLADKASNRQR